MTDKDALIAARDAEEEIRLDGEGAGCAPVGDVAPPSAPPPDAPIPDAPPLEKEAAEMPLNDYGNGSRLVHYYGHDLLFVPRLGWHRWDGRRWASDEDAITVRLDAQEIGARIMKEAEFLFLSEVELNVVAEAEAAKSEAAEIRKIAIDDRSVAQVGRLEEIEALGRRADAARAALSKRKREHASFSKQSGNTSRISNMLTEAQPRLATAIGDLNPHRLDICCQNGVVRLRAEPDPVDVAMGAAFPGTLAEADLVPHARDQKITKMVAAAYDPDAVCPTFDAFLARIQPQEDMRTFLQMWFGYCLTGETHEQKLAFLYGGGRNGKSTLVDVIARILSDYSTTLPIETLTGTEQRKGSDATPDLVRLPGARFVRASEPEQGQKMKEALVKSLTGGEAILVRRMMQEFVEIEPEFKLTISGNYKPEVRGADDGIWRRILLVPFLQQIPDADVDGALPAKLWAERDGIFAWMVRGALLWLENGLALPDAIREATEIYRTESDPARQFLSSECEITGHNGDWVSAADLGGAFNGWLLRNGTASWGKRQTSNAFKLRAGNVRGPGGGCYSEKKRSISGYMGLRLTASAKECLEAWQQSPASLKS